MTRANKVCALLTTMTSLLLEVKACIALMNT